MEKSFSSSEIENKLRILKNIYEKKNLLDKLKLIKNDTIKKELLAKYINYYSKIKKIDEVDLQKYYQCLSDYKDALFKIENLHKKLQSEV